MRKYDPLMKYLDNCNKEEITLSYGDIEKILGGSLPDVAYRNKAWWSNHDNSHTQSSAWSDVGYRTCNIVLGESVTFKK